MKRIKNILINSKTLILIFFAVAILVIVSVIYDLIQSKKEMLNLMSRQSHSLLETVLVSSQEVLYAADQVEEEMNERLLNNANFIKILLEQGKVTNTLLEQIAEKNNIHRVNIFNKNGKKIYHNYTPQGDIIRHSNSLPNELKPIISGEIDTLIIGIKKARMNQAFRYVVAVASKNKDAIVLNLEADKLLEFRKNIGFGVLLKRLVENNSLIYAALQDEENIIAASGEVDSLEELNTSEFLTNAIVDSVFAWRILEIGDKKVFEAVHPFEIEGEVVGLYRIGLSLESLDNINLKLTRRAIISGIMLFVFGSFLMTLLFVKQNFKLLQNKFISMEKYSANLIRSVSDAIVVVNKENKIKELNPAAENLFSITKNSINKSIISLFTSEQVNDIIEQRIFMKQLDCWINNTRKSLLISKSEFADENGELSFVLIIKDLTEIKYLEKQVARNEQLKAMGELASGVAHEIRNPLNTIGTIVQQLDKDFKPKENEEEYHSLSSLVYNEVKRINDTVQNFLRFSKPEPIQKIEFEFSKLINDVAKQFESTLIDKNITFKLENSFAGNVNWDKNKIKQVLINLIKNGEDAIENKGVILVSCKQIENDKLQIQVNDTGKGISKETEERIFNLYYTTKASGTGIGLSIVQRIISEHDGTIEFNSEVGKGTEFKIILPIN